jgi:murein DD-endopeptidase MepM/ murein hydrolase activator NlpD
MRRVDEPGRSLRLFRLAVLASISVAAVSCSSDTHRFESDRIFRSSSNVQAPANEVTGSVPQRQAAIQSSPLPPPPNASAPATRPAAAPRAVASYEPAPQTSAAKRAWNWEGGTAITVQKGDTIDGLVKRYGVPASAIAEANNIPNGTALRPGQKLVIPKYEATGSTTPRNVTTAAPPATGTNQHVHVVAPGETLMALSRKYQKPLAELAKANKIEPHTLVKVGDRIVIPGQTSAAPRLAAPAPAAQPKVAQAAPQIAAKPAPQIAAKPETAPVAKPQSSKVAKVDAPPSANIVAPAADPLPETAPTGTTGNSSVSLRWPVRGKVIQAFGPKTTGGQNDGINVAVPEGTPIKAAEDGVVAYAGSELKGYGNLVLVRHSNGFVTAYAHASELSVKKGETIKRGQVIGKAGSTGNVTSPQLHFEVRKGATPVDPSQYLTGG